MKFEVSPLNQNNVVLFKKSMQEAFQQGAIDGLGETSKQILPEQDIDSSLSAPGSIAYEVSIDGVFAGGAIVTINEETQHNHLDFLYVKKEVQSKGVGKLIWESIEKHHPKTEVWETFTPYFEKRNIHFYVNKCGFHIVEYFNELHKDPHDVVTNKKDRDYFSGMFRFEKIMS